MAPSVVAVFRGALSAASTGCLKLEEGRTEVGFTSNTSIKPLGLETFLGACFILLSTCARSLFGPRASLDVGFVLLLW